MISPKNLAIGFFVIATLGLGTLAWQQYQELIGLRAAALNTDERADLQKRLWAAEKRARDLEGELAAARKAGPEDAIAALAAQDDNANQRGQRGGQRGNAANGAALRALLEKPEIQHLLSLQQKAALDARYAALFKKLNLSPEQIDKVKDLMVEKQASRQDVMAVAREQGIDPRTDPAGYRKLMQDAQADSDNALKAALGDSGYAQLQQYDQTMPQRGVVNQLQQSLSFTSAPLTDAQADQLVQILARTSQTNAGGNNGGGQGGFRGGFGGGFAGGGGPGAAIAGAFAAFGGANNAPVTTEAITQAQGILSASQLAALQQIQQTQQAQAQVQQMIRETMGANPQNAGSARAQKRAAKQ